MSDKATREEAPLKAVLMRTILDDLAARNIPLKQAAELAQTDYDRLNHMRRGGKGRYFSIGYLLRVAERTGVRLRIRVELVP